MISFCLFSAIASLGFIFGYFTACLMVAAKQGDAQMDRIVLRQALRDARAALWRCANDADAGSSEALAACLAIDQVVDREK